jgi:hypothetical protein
LRSSGEGVAVAAKACVFANFNHLTNGYRQESYGNSRS